MGDGRWGGNLRAERGLMISHKRHRKHRWGRVQEKAKNRE
jgi:hypothetical protein